MLALGGLFQFSSRRWWCWRPPRRGGGGSSEAGRGRLTFGGPASLLAERGGDLGGRISKFLYPTQAIGIFTGPC